MKNFLLIWNAILTLALGYVLFQNSNRSEVIEVEEPTEVKDSLVSEEAPEKDMRIVFVNTDSLFADYDMYKDLEEELLAEKVRMEGRYKREVEKFEKEYLDLREKAPFMTQSQGEQAQAQLMQKQQDILKMEQDLSTKFANRESEMVMQIKDEIENYLKNTNDEFGYKLVLGKSDLGGILYADDGIDITKEVVIGLNEEYRKKKSSK